MNSTNDVLLTEKHSISLALITGQFYPSCPTIYDVFFPHASMMSFAVPVTCGVLRRQPHCHSGLANLPSGSHPLVTAY